MKRLPFYINNYCLVTSAEDIDLSAIPALHKRRLSNIDKIALTVLFKSYQEDINEIVFSSQYGEFERLKVIIEQYQEFNEVSPIQFSGSVHNFPVGNFCQITKNNLPYNAISSCANSISAGIIKSVISPNKKILLCYADFIEKPQGFGCIISHEKPAEHSIKCELEQISQKNNENFEDLCDFLNGKISVFNSEFCKIERIEK